MKPAAKVVPLLLLASAFLASAESAPRLTLREKINSVICSDTSDGSGGALVESTLIQAPQYVRTGSRSRADFGYGDGTIRLGAESGVRLDRSAGLRFLGGSLLYEKLTRANPLAAQLGKMEVVVTGDTGFVNFTSVDPNGQSFLSIGSVSGGTTVRVDGEKHSLRPMEVFTISSKGQVFKNHFNLPKQLKTSLLVNGFENPLPNLKAIGREAKRYASLEARGFIRPLQISQRIEPASTKDALAKSDNGRIDSRGDRSSDADSVRVALHEDITLAGSATTTRADLVNVVDQVGFGSRVALISSISGAPRKGNNGLGNGQDPPPPDWLKPRPPGLLGNPGGKNTQGDSVGSGSVVNVQMGRGRNSPPLPPPPPPPSH